MPSYCCVCEYSAVYTQCVHFYFHEICGKILPKYNNKSKSPDVCIIQSKYAVEIVKYAMKMSYLNSEHFGETNLYISKTTDSIYDY